MTAYSALLAPLGGEQGIGDLVSRWYPTVLGDPLLGPLFGAGHPDHVPHLTAFLVEVFGGPASYTEGLGGFPALLAHHRGLEITQAQRHRFAELFLAAYDDTPHESVPDPEVRRSLAAYLDFGTEVAMVNSHARGDEDLHPCQVVPRWP